MNLKFEILHRSKRSRARVGRIHTAHGVIDTPNFVAVGTNGTVKALDNTHLHEAGLQLMFCNTYHLMLQPGREIIRQAGGLHAFIRRQLPIITDSGGFQVFSLNYGSVANELKGSGKKKTGGSVLKINEEGVLFRSYRDGQEILLTPESSIAAQKDFGSDIIIPLDELPPYHISSTELETSLERTHRWEERSLQAHLANRKNQMMYGVIHGGVAPVLRQKSLDFLKKLPFDGFAIGGSLGKNKGELNQLLQFLMPQMLEDKPNHLLGIGDLESIDFGVPLGVDTFDSSYPTRAARHGLLLTKNGPIKIEKMQHKTSFEALDVNCHCHTCMRFSRAFLHHLFKAREVTYLQLATLHNLHFMISQMAEYRQKILDGDL
jgi:queuine tRNA-ribosyltransferase